LSLQALGQFTARAARQPWNVINGFVGIQCHALTAHMRQHIHHMRLGAQQAQFEHLKQADRTGADDQRIGFNGDGVIGHVDAAIAGVVQRSNSESLPVLSFQASASGKGDLRLVMLGQPIWESSALRAVMCS